MVNRSKNLRVVKKNKNCYFNLPMALNTSSKTLLSAIA